MLHQMRYLTYMSDNRSHEKILTEKLLTKFHLNNIERKELPDGKVKFSMIVTVIKEILSESGWFPKDWRLDMSFCGGLLEIISENKVNFYHKEEIALNKYKVIEVKKNLKIEKATYKFLKTTFGSQIDGIEIDFNT